MVNDAYLSPKMKKFAKYKLIGLLVLIPEIQRRAKDADFTKISSQDHLDLNRFFLLITIT